MRTGNGPELWPYIEHMGKVDEETLGRITEGVGGGIDRYNKEKDIT